MFIQKIYRAKEITRATLGLLGTFFMSAWIFHYSSYTFCPMYMCVCVFVCVCVHFWGTVSTYFCPHFLKSDVQSFRDSESLVKSNEKKWSQIWKLLLIKGVKSSRKKKIVIFFTKVALLSRIFLVSVFLTLFNGLFAPTSLSPMSKLFLILGILGEKGWEGMVTDLRIFAHKGCKTTAAKSVFYNFFSSFVYSV